jgi:hypothetical protein
MARSTMALLMPLLAFACGSGKHGPSHAIGGDSGVDAGDGGGGGDIDASGATGGQLQAGPGGIGGASAELQESGAPATMGGEAGAPALVSKFCGDAIRDPRTEGCDDGPGDDADSCSSSCEVRNVLVVDEDRSTKRSRYLGFGAHPLAANAGTAGVVFTQTEGATTTLYLSRFSDLGQRLGTPVALSAGLAADEQSNPVLVGLADDRYVAAWSDKSGGTLDVVLRPVSAAGLVGDPIVANKKVSGAQFDPDLLWAGEELAVAWTDGFDIKLRTFTSELLPTDDELTLSSGGFAGDVTLASHASSWAAAFREATEMGDEQIGVVLGDGTRFVVGPIVAGPSGDHPALVSLDAKRLLLVFTSSREGVPRLGGAILNVDDPSEVTLFEPAALEPSDIDSALEQRRPALAKVGDRVVLTWQSSSPPDDVLGQEIFLAELALDGDSTANVQVAGKSSLLLDWPGAGAQERPAIASAYLHHDDVLLSVFEQASVWQDSKVVPDLVFGFAPWPAPLREQEGKP